MRDLTDRTAFVTGGASGIGFALGRAFAEAGMKVMLADIETSALDARSTVSEPLAHMCEGFVAMSLIRPAWTAQRRRPMKSLEMCM